MEYLEYEELYRYNIVDYKGEKLLLIERDDDSKTFIEHSKEKNNGEYIDLNAEIFIMERWKVDILPPDNFHKTFTTHRIITAYYCKYRDLIKEERKSFKMKEQLDNHGIPFINNQINDDFNDNF